MRFSLYTLMVFVLLIGSIMMFVARWPAWQLVRTVTPGEIIKEAWLADEGRKLVIVGTKIRVFDRYSMAELRSFETQAEDDYFTAPVISKHHDMVAFYDMEGRVSVYSLVDLRRILQTELIPNIGIQDREPFNRMCFSDAGEFVVVPISHKEFNAYSLTGGKDKKPLVKEEFEFGIMSYFEKPEIVFKKAKNNYMRDNTRFEFYSVIKGRRIFDYNLNRSGWVDCALASNGTIIFAHDGNGNFARLDLNIGLPDVFDGRFIGEFQDNIFGFSLSDNSIVRVHALKGVAPGANVEYSVYSSPDMRPLSKFQNFDESCVVRHALDEYAQRLFMVPRSLEWTDRYRFQIVDLKTGETLFGLKERGEQDFDVKANCAISYDRERLKIYIRDHPEWWWGHFYRVETWLIVLFLGLLIWRMAANVRRQFSRREQGGIVELNSTLRKHSQGI